MNLISAIEKNHLKNIPDLKPGDTVKVSQKVKEGNKERIQVFEGVVIRHSSGTGINATFTVRKISNGIGVERTFPLHSPNIVKIEIVRRAKVRRAFLGYLRELRGKKAKLKEKGFDKLAANVEDRDIKPEEIAQTEVEEVVENVETPEVVNEETVETATETPETTEEQK